MSICLRVCALVIIVMVSLGSANHKTVNLYTWAGVFPKAVLKQFERETGITVTYSTYDNNETLLTKLKVTKRPLYDVIYPSSYFIERLRKHNLLHQLDHTKLPNLKHIDPYFLNHPYDPKNRYNIPLAWGGTGIVYNRKYIKKAPTDWRDLWQKQFQDALMLLDDPREVFSMALLDLGYSPNDVDPQHIEQAFKRLETLRPNIKLFASDSVKSLLIDEDAHVGLAWNGDAYKSHTENSNLDFVYPASGYVIWIDCLAIPKNAPHLNEAYLFLNFIMRPDIAAKIAVLSGAAITNQTAKERLPKEMRNNPWLYPDESTRQAGIIQQDVTAEANAFYYHYWSKLKLSM